MIKTLFTLFSSCYFVLEIPLFLRPGAWFWDELPGVGGEGGARPGQPNRGQVQLEKCCQTWVIHIFTLKQCFWKWTNSSHLAQVVAECRAYWSQTLTWSPGPESGHSSPDKTLLKILTLNIQVPNLEPLLQRLAGERVDREVRGENKLEDGLHHPPHCARALVSLKCRTVMLNI